jgi:tRNA A37 threonylcarbamoyladenosine synthetase subunit TsaC/SUA5/YrdC
VLRGDPAHKIVNPLLYRIEEVQACWRETSAPVLWVDAAESDTLKRLGLSEAQHAERRNSFKNLKHVTVRDAGHMLHHDQPEEVARLIEDFSPDDAVSFGPSDASAEAADPPRRRGREAGRLIAYPTDSCYALGCDLGATTALERLRRIRGVDERHRLTLMCRDLSEISAYAIVDDARFRLLKSATPGSYTFILPARRQVPRRATSRKTIGVRIPGHPAAHALLAELDAPMLSATLTVAGRRGAARRRGGNPRAPRKCSRRHRRRRTLRRRAVHGHRSDESRAAGGARGKGIARAVCRPARLIDLREKDGRQSPGPDGRHLRPPGAVRDHAARGGARLRGALFRRHDGARAGAHQPEPDPPHRPRGNDRGSGADPLRLEPRRDARASCSAGRSRCR